MYEHKVHFYLLYDDRPKGCNSKNTYHEIINDYDIHTSQQTQQTEGKTVKMYVTIAFIK